VSFARLCAIALDESLGPGRRLRALRRAIASYSWLTHTSYESTLAALEARHGLRATPPRAGAIAGAIRELMAAREAFVAAAAGYAALRRVEKRAGRRRPSASSLGVLYRLPALGTPRASSPAHWHVNAADRS
jgi:hypothetical protein